MNLNITPENEFQMMEQFFQNGGTLDNMPQELLRVRRIWKRADEILRKFPWYDNEKIANQLIADLHEYQLSLSTAKNHVTYAKKYFNFVEAESPETHRRILTELAYKQIAVLEKLQLEQPRKAHQVSKVIEQWHNRIASINHLYDKQETEKEDNRDIFVVLSDDDLKFEDVPYISDKELYSIIDDVAEFADMTPSEKQKMIDKDVKGKLI